MQQLSDDPFTSHVPGKQCGFCYCLCVSCASVPLIPNCSCSGNSSPVTDSPYLPDRPVPEVPTVPARNEHTLCTVHTAARSSAVARYPTVPSCTLYVRALSLSPSVPLSLVTLPLPSLSLSLLPLCLSASLPPTGPARESHIPRVNSPVPV